MTETGTRIWLYDREGEDAPVRLEDKNIPHLDDNQMLWVDADLSAADELAESGTCLIAVDVFAVDASADFRPVALHCFVGPNWVATLHVG